MRSIILAVGVWTLLVAAVWLVTPTLLSASPCADLAPPGPGCATLDAVASDFAWDAQRRPMAVLSVGGYVVIALMAFSGRRR